MLLGRGPAELGGPRDLALVVDDDPCWDVRAAEQLLAGEERVLDLDCGAVGGRKPESVSAHVQQAAAVARPRWH